MLRLNIMLTLFLLDELLGNNEIDLIINFTIPARPIKKYSKITSSMENIVLVKPLAMNFEEGLEIQKLVNDKNLYGISSICF